MVAFDAERDIPSRGWVLGLNQHLPDDVAVRAARAVAAGFSPASRPAASAIVTGCWSTSSAILGGARARGGCPSLDLALDGAARRRARRGHARLRGVPLCGRRARRHRAHRSRASPSNPMPIRASSASSSRATRFSTTWCASWWARMADVARGRLPPGSRRSSARGARSARRGDHGAGPRPDARARRPRAARRGGRAVAALSRPARVSARAPLPGEGDAIAALWRELWDAHEAWGGYPGSRDPRVYARSRDGSTRTRACARAIPSWDATCTSSPISPAFPAVRSRDGSIATEWTRRRRSRARCAR